MKSNIIWLQEWLLKNCYHEDYDNYYKIRMETIDNPGWSLQVELRETQLENAEFKPIFVQREDENDWLSCCIEKQEFCAACGPENLDEVIGIFRAWCETLKSEEEVLISRTGESI